MNKFDRIISILIQLQSRKIVRAQDIAERFEISLRTVYRDIRTLEKAGIPIISEAGVGYSIMPGYHLPPVMFSEDEATAMVTAEKLVEKMADRSTVDQFRSAMFKIKSVLRSDEKETVENLNDHIEVYRQPWSNEPATFSGMPAILKAIREKKVINILYRAGYNDQQTRRELEPIGIYFSSENWYLIAYCKLRKAYRNFRLDRIQDLRLTDNQFNTQHPLLKEYLESLAEEQQLQKAVVSFNKEVTQYANPQKFMFGFTHEKEVGDKVEMSFLTPSLNNMARWLLMYTNSITIESPQELKNEIQKLTIQAFNHYN